MTNDTFDINKKLKTTELNAEQNTTDITNLQTNLTNHNHNHNDLNDINGGTYHLTETDYNELSGRQLFKNSAYSK